MRHVWLGWRMTNERSGRPLARQRRLAELLIVARMDAGMTQVELSSRLGRTQSYVSKVEAGERRIDVMELLDLAEALGCDYRAILSEVEVAGR